MKKLLLFGLILTFVACAATPAPESPQPEPEKTPAEKAKAFKEKVKAKCLTKYPDDKKLRRKACNVLLMGAVRTACRLDGKVEELCEKNEKYCTPEVEEIVQEGLAFCEELAKD